ncbi:MAG TPA: hypothetical protein P5121_16155 [Caldilineaceae bacterium]|nr:hypothetical protein [Caldilineaceae bacterium]
MSMTPCPYLVSEDPSGRQRAPQPYPSFENSCLAAARNHSLLLADQATFCLSGACHICERYQAAMAGEQASAPEPTAAQWQKPPSVKPAVGAAIPSQAVANEMPFLDEDPWVGTAGAPEEFTATGTPWQQVSTRWYSWAAAALLFFAVLSVGGVFAAYTGWQLALDKLATARAGQVNTLASAPVEQVQPQFIVMTATDEPQVITLPTTSEPVVAPRSGLDAKQSSDNEPQVPTGYPPAVTATPVVVVPLPPTAQPSSGQQDSTVQEDAGQQPQPTATLASIELPAVESTPTPVPIINVQVAVPTRRPTPEFDIPTSTPEPPQPTPTETPLPILGTPIVVFAADETTIPPGECTHVRWHVENVRAVYYESLPAFGDGSKEECLDDEADSYALTVTFADGQTKIYTTTVGILWPTPTPSITPSFTPEILPTETWTPIPPTATPTPNVIYGAKLEINGENPYRCSVGTQCNIGVLATNTGDSLDTLAIEVLETGPWPVTVCSQIGTCSSQRLVIANVGPQNTVFVTLQITPPAESAGQTTAYLLRAVSDGSGGSVTSQVIELMVESTE